MFKKIEHIIALLMLLFAVGYNLYTYRLEPTAKIDPNDNPFQFALVYRTNEMWDFALRTCPKTITYPICFTGYLIDHWVPNWAQGFNLPYYYGHFPQISIVASYRFLHLFFANLTLFAYYHIVIYALLCLFPISVFMALSIIGLSPIAVGFGALLASQVSTDGLYGLDPSSFLWRGYGLSSQLFAMIWMPQALAYAYRFFRTNISVYEKLKQPKKLVTLLLSSLDFRLSVLFTVLTISGHLGIGVIGMMSIGILAISPLCIGILKKVSVKELIRLGREHISKLVFIAGLSIFVLSYFILPAQLDSKFHNLSFWDPVWKFDSWGWKEVMNLFTNGYLFDFGRGFPYFTALIFIGGFSAFFKRKDKEDDMPLTAFSFLFLFWIVMFFGRATWGGLIDLIPSMRDFHQSRFIVGVHLTGMLLAPIGFAYLVDVLTGLFVQIQPAIKTFLASLEEKDDEELDKAKKRTLTISPVIPLIIGVLLSVIGVIAIYPQTSRYSSFNDVLIKRGNDNFDKQNPDVQKLFADFKTSTPGRVFTGRGGSWGKKLTIAETTYFLHLSTYGVPVILWLPETWSPSSDVEQFFIEDRPEHYDLLNVRYVVTTPDIEAKSFWKLKDETPSWKLYEVPTNGYFGSGSLAAVVSTGKEWYVNVVRLWLQSDYPKNKIFPQLTFSKKEMMSAPIPAFGMLDEANFQTRDNKIFSIFGAPPTYEAPDSSHLTVVGPEKVDSDMIFSTKVKVDAPCPRCLVFLKQSNHPNWQAYVNGKKVPSFITFPFYSAVKLETPGEYTVEFKYQPKTSKLFLFVIGMGTLVALFVPWGKIVTRIKNRDKKKRLSSQG
jgi:hypothetical protein